MVVREYDLGRGKGFKVVGGGTCGSLSRGGNKSETLEWILKFMLQNRMEEQGVVNL